MEAVEASVAAVASVVVEALVADVALVVAEALEVAAVLVVVVSEVSFNNINLLSCLKKLILQVKVMEEDLEKKMLL